MTSARQPPMRAAAFAGVPAGALQEALNASDDMKSIMGIYDACLGARSNETSGRAIMARQREGDVSTFHFIDNLSRAIRHAGRILHRPDPARLRPGRGSCGSSARTARRPAAARPAGAGDGRQGQPEMEQQGVDPMTGQPMSRRRPASMT